MHRTLAALHVLTLVAAGLAGCLGPSEPGTPRGGDGAGAPVIAQLGPLVRFALLPEHPSDAGTVRAIDLSRGPVGVQAVEQNWSVDGQALASGPAPTLALAAGAHEVCLHVRWAPGPERNACTEVVVENEPPVVAFHFTRLPGTPMEALFLTDASYDPSRGGGIVERAWSLDGSTVGDGDTLTVVVGPGTHVVALTVTDAGGRTASHERAFSVAAPRPIARLALDRDSVLEDEPVTARDVSVLPGGEGALARRWTSSAGAVPTHAAGAGTANAAFPTAGVHQVCVEVQAPWGATDAACRTVHIVNRPPQVGLSWSPPRPSADTPVLLVASAHDPSPQGRIVEHRWHVDGRALGPGAPAMNVTFDTKGPHTVGVEVVDDLGARAWTNATIEVVNRPPVLVLPDPPSLRVNRTLEVPVVATDPDGDAVHIALVAAPPGLAFDRSAGTLSWRPPPGTEGVHPIVVEASDGEDTVRSVVPVEVLVNRPPVVLVGGERVLEAGREATVTAASSFDPDGQGPLSFRWWWNGSGPREPIGTGPNVTLVAPAGGRYTLTVEARDADGMAVVEERPVWVDDALVAKAHVEGAGVDAFPWLIVEVSDDLGEPVPNATLSYAVVHDARQLQLDRGTAVTDRGGMARVQLDRDTCAGPRANLPGPHTVTVVARAPSRADAWLPGTELALAFARYQVGPAAEELALAADVANEVPRDPLFGGVERGTLRGACALAQGDPSELPFP